MAYSCFSYSNKQFKAYYKCQKDTAVFSLYYPACANMKYHRNSATSLHLGEFDGCVCRILNQRLPRGLPWSVMLDWWWGCGCKLFAAAYQHRRCGCNLPRSWSCPCGMKWRQARHQRLVSFGQLFRDSALLQNTGTKSCNIFGVPYTQWNGNQRTHQLAVLWIACISGSHRIKSVE